MRTPPRRPRSERVVRPGSPLVPNAIGQRWYALPQGFRREVASGPYCASRSSRTMTVEVNCRTWVVFWSNVFLADAISRPSTSAVRVPIRPPVSLTTSLESGCRWCSDNNGRTTIPASAPPNITANTRSEITRSFIRANSPPSCWLSRLSPDYAARPGRFQSFDRFWMQTDMLPSIWCTARGADFVIERLNQVVPRLS